MNFQKNPTACKTDSFKSEILSDWQKTTVPKKPELLLKQWHLYDHLGENKDVYILSWKQVLLEEDTVLSYPANH